MSDSQVDASRPHLTGDLARLRQWWDEHSPTAQRNVTWIDLASAPETPSDAVDKAIDAGCSLVIVHCSDPQFAANSARSTIAAASGTGAAAVIAQPEDMDDLTWMRTVAAVRDARPDAIADPVIDAAVEVLLRCSERRTPVIFDGLLAHAAAIRASHRSGEAGHWWMPAASSTDPGIKRAQLTLDNRAALDLHLSTDSDSEATVLAVQAVLAVLDVVAPAES